MKLIDLLEVIDENMNLKVIDKSGEEYGVEYTYNGKDSIPEEINEKQVILGSLRIDYKSLIVSVRLR